MTLESPPTANQLAQERTDLAATRTLMAADRTLMAWVRTALSLQSFGFTIYKVLEGFQQSGRVMPAAETPRNAGLFLTAMGTIAMLMGIAEYLQVRTELRELRAVRLARPSLMMSVLMAVAGVLLFFGIVARVL